MDLKAKHLSETCSDPIEFLYQLRQTTESIGGGTEYSEDGEFVEYDVAIEAVRKANDAFIEKAVKYVANHFLAPGMDNEIKDFVNYMKEE